MNTIKRYLGLVWMLLGPVIIFILMKSAVDNIDPAGKGDINKPIPWIIVITIFTPVAIGLMIFGWYAWKGEYHRNDELRMKASDGSKPSDA